MFFTLFKLIGKHFPLKNLANHGQQRSVNSEERYEILKYRTSRKEGKRQVGF